MVIHGQSQGERGVGGLGGGEESVRGKRVKREREREIQRKTESGKEKKKGQ